jgi:uncharacterized protein (UPF0548 family)
LARIMARSQSQSDGILAVCGSTTRARLPSACSGRHTGAGAAVSEATAAGLPTRSCRVRVLHADAQSLTLGTLEGRPEAGRITFGADRNPAGDVIFHIRSRARSVSMSKRVGFLAIGDVMQTNPERFINNLAAAVAQLAARVDQGPTGSREDTARQLSTGLERT